MNGDDELRKETEEEAASDEEFEQTVFGQDASSERGDVKDNPYNTRRNHLITLLWACLLAAALILMDYAGVNRLGEPLDGFVDVIVRELQSGSVYSAENQYYTIAENGKYEQIEPFEADNTEYLVTDLYEHEQGRINYLTEYRLYPDEDRDDIPDGEALEITPVLERILDLVEETETEHWIFKARILRSGDRYFVCVDRNVNLWTPYVLYYYSEDRDSLTELATFDGLQVTEIRLSEDFEERVGA